MIFLLFVSKQRININGVDIQCGFLVTRSDSLTIFHLL